MNCPKRLNHKLILSYSAYCSGITRKPIIELTPILFGGNILQYKKICSEAYTALRAV